MIVMKTEDDDFVKKSVSVNVIPAEEVGFLCEEGFEDAEGCEKNSQKSEPQIQGTDGIHNTEHGKTGQGPQEINQDSHSRV